MTIAGTEARRIADRAVDERRLLAIGMEADREPAGPLGDVRKRVAGAARLVPWWGFAGVGGLAVPFAIVVAERVGQAKGVGAPVCYAQGADLAGCTSHQVIRAATSSTSHTPSTQSATYR